MDLGELNAGLNALDVAFADRDNNGNFVGLREGSERLPVVTAKFNHLTRGVDLIGPDGESITQEDLGFSGSGEKIFELASSTYGTDVAALKTAIAAAVSAGVPLIVDVDYDVTMASDTDAIELPSDFTMIFRGGSVTMNTFGYPLFFAREKSGITIHDADIRYSGTAGTSITGTANAFYSSLSWPSGYAFPQRDTMAMFLFLGCDDVTLESPKFTATSSDIAGVICRAITVTTKPDGSRSKRIKINSPIFDGVSFGVLAWNVEDFELNNVFVAREGQLPIATYTWEAAGHAFYLSDTSATENRNVRIIGVHDTGVRMTGSSLVDGYSTCKLLATRGFLLKDVQSYCDTGAMDFASSDGTIDGVRWKGSLSVAGGTANLWTNMRPVRFLTSRGITESAAKVIRDVVARNIVIEQPDDAFVSLELSPSGGTANNIDMEITIKRPATLLSTTTPMMTFGASNSRLKLIAKSSTFVNGGMAVRLDGTVTDTTVYVEHDSDVDDVLVKEQSVANSLRNTAEVLNKFRGWRSSSKESTLLIREASVELTTTAAASVTATSLIPAGAIVVGVTTLTTTGMQGTGVTNYQVGDGTDPDRWGQSLGVNAYRLTDNTFWTDPSILVATTAKSVVITAVGGSFDAGKKIKVSVHYLTARSNGSV